MFNYFVQEYSERCKTLALAKAKKKDYKLKAENQLKRVEIIFELLRDARFGLPDKDKAIEWLTTRCEKCVNTPARWFTLGKYFASVATTLATAYFAFRGGNIISALFTGIGKVLSKFGNIPLTTADHIVVLLGVAAEYALLRLAFESFSRNHSGGIYNQLLSDLRVLYIRI